MKVTLDTKTCADGTEQYVIISPITELRFICASYIPRRDNILHALCTLPELQALGVMGLPRTHAVHFRVL